MRNDIGYVYAKKRKSRGAVSKATLCVVERILTEYIFMQGQVVVCWCVCVCRLCLRVHMNKCASASLSVTTSCHIVPYHTIPFHTVPVLIKGKKKEGKKTTTYRQQRVRMLASAHSPSTEPRLAGSSGPGQNGSPSNPFEQKMCGCLFTGASLLPETPCLSDRPN